MEDIRYTFAEYFVPFVLSVVIIVSVVFLAKYGFQKQEKVDCYHLQQQATQYPNFWITKVDKEMCDAHHITINATVK